jgi:hypothetical protein
MTGNHMPAHIGKHSNVGVCFNPISLPESFLRLSPALKFTASEKLPFRKGIGMKTADY